MRCTSFFRSPIALAMFAFASMVLLDMLVDVAAGQERTKRRLDHDAVNRWRRIEGEAISADGRAVLYTLKPGKGDATLRIHSATAADGYSIRRGASALFSKEGRFAVYLIEPEEELVKKAEKEERKRKKQPNDDSQDADVGPKKTLEILNLESGRTLSIGRVKSFHLPKEAGGWIAYLMERPPEKKTVEPGANGEAAEAEPATTEPPETQQEPEAKPDPKCEPEDESDEKEKETGTELVLRDLNSGAKFRYRDVLAYHFSEDGKLLVYSASAEKGEEDGVFAVEVATGNAQPVLTGRGNYKGLAIDKAGHQLAFLSNRDAYEAEQPDWTVYHWQHGMTDARAIATAASQGLSEGWWISEHRDPSFSETGKRLLFGTSPRPEPDGDDEEKEEEREDDESDEPEVEVDIWHWKDPLLQPNQLEQLEEEQKRSFLAVLHLEDGKIVQLATGDVPEVAVGTDGDADIALGTSDLPYRMLRSWDYPGYEDVYLIDVQSGDRAMVLEKLQGDAELSPQSKYITWWDNKKLAWFAMSVEKREPVNLTELLPYPAQNELHDLPARPRPYGSAGWVEGDKAFLIYDRHDIWATNPEGFWPPMCVTDHVGREQNLRFRYVQLDPEEKAIPAEAPLLLSAFHLETKASGFYRERFRSAEKPQELVMLDEQLTIAKKAEDVQQLLLTRSTFQRFPDLWTANLDLQDMKQISRANPQQPRYLWGTAELVEWSSLDGERLEGILYKPEGFDPAQKYPLLVYFYERNSDRLHRHVSPEAGRASINYSFYVSRGYVLFVPDIPYRVGYPGQSAVNSVLPGVTSLIDAGYIDKDRIGVQGHSWGGYQIAYLVTRTNLFAAAEAGAPVSNMTSAYGGIRWQSGLSRMFQYEKTQSRIGGTLWDAQQRFIENSPIFWVDKIETPLLILHNDKDGAVPWYQGIELFVAMRRLGKPAWMFNYNGEAHGLGEDHNRRDWAIRLQQFFDHYLMHAPPPVWLAEGVPAIEKGKTLGLDLLEEKRSGDTP